MTKSELRVAQALQSGCQTLCMAADSVDPRRQRKGLAEQVDKIMIGMATTFNELTGQNIYNCPGADLDPNNPARWAQRRAGWRSSHTSHHGSSRR